MLLLYLQMKVWQLIFLLSYNQDVSLPEVKVIRILQLIMIDLLYQHFLSSARNLIDIQKYPQPLSKSDQRQFSQLLPVQALVYSSLFPPFKNF
ncbi:hypothetical protein SeW_A5122 [Salmonella enterica subsp. enterica serovar Weltevreden str. HI_N05-537]|nr:hypothetical protein SeW_A5122 [Salmonella enterica subsp. enterica serovar Weltevreden str. HI_N05-537]QUN03499.1 hypothetical protein [Salmonella enterica subsp. enterica serovar Weltevreden]